MVKIIERQFTSKQKELVEFFPNGPLVVTLVAVKLVNSVGLVIVLEHSDINDLKLKGLAIVFEGGSSLDLDVGCADSEMGGKDRGHEKAVAVETLDGGAVFDGSLECLVALFALVILLDGLLKKPDSLGQVVVGLLQLAVLLGLLLCKLLQLPRGLNVL